jgi:xylono-1,5-lactonase
MFDVSIVPRDRRDALGEGPTWSGRDGALYWVDILGRGVNRLVIATGDVTSVATPDLTGWLIERETGGFLAGCRNGVHGVSADLETWTPLLDLEPDLPLNRMNDAKTDRQGRIWAGSMCDGQARSGLLHRIDPDFSTHRMDDGYRIANGPAITPDGRSLMHTDTGDAVIYRFDLDDSGTLSGKRIFRRFDPAEEGRPDGMIFDADEGLWVAHWGGGRLSRYDLEGRLTARIDLPASQVTSLAFAGDGLSRMFVTSAADGREGEPAAGALFEVRGHGTRGVPAQRFGG